MNNDTLPPIWVISLRRSTERRDTIRRHLHDLGLAFEIVDAVDGRTLNPRTLAETYRPRQARAYYGRELVAEEVACALSHRLLYRRMLTERIDVALILEDDARLAADLPRLLAARAYFPADWDLVLLQHGNGVISWWGRKRVAPARRLGRFANPPWGAVGYLLQREAARRLLAQGDLVRAPADHWQLAMDAGLVIYGLEPQGIGTYRGEDPDFSTIPGRGAARRAAGLPTLEPGLVSSLHRLKQSLIRLFLRFRWPRP